MHTREEEEEEEEEEEGGGDQNLTRNTHGFRRSLFAKKPDPVFSVRYEYIQS